MRQAKKRVSLTEHIIKVYRPELESAHVKVAKHSPLNVSKDREQDAVNFDYYKIKEYLAKTGAKFYTAIHTHRTGWWHGKKRPRTRPSMPDDLYFFLKNDKEKFMGIAEQCDDGSVTDYILFKKKRNPTANQLSERNILIEDVEKNYKKISPKYIMEYYELENKIGEDEIMKKIAEKYGLIYRFVPVPADHLANKRKFAEAKRKRLEQTLGIISIAGFLFSVLFLSGITGNVIGATETKNILGLISILIGLTTGGIYFYLKKKH